MHLLRLALAALSALTLASAIPLHEITITYADATTVTQTVYAPATTATATVTQTVFAAPPTSWLPCADCVPATITAATQLVTSVRKDIKTTSFRVSTAGVYTPPHQSSVWTVHEPTWVTYEVPCATVYIMPYAAAVCATCAKEVHVIVFVNLDITFSAHQIWTPTTNSDGSSSTSTATVSAASTSIGYTPTYATGPFGPVKTYSVTVSGLRYQPEAVAGRVGDVVEFVFGAGNHSVTQADFSNPCIPKAGGFGSGFRTDVEGVWGQVVATYKIETEAPAWFYCAQREGPRPHCEAGMVFAVNAPGDGERTLEGFRKAAIGAPLELPAGSSAATATATASAARVTHLVTVGGLADGKPMLRYNPETVLASVGDIIEFNFRAANHTVTQSSFDSPCMGIPDGFRTGVQMNPQDTDNLILRQFEVRDSKPLWFYCGVATHCQQGMVFAVNPLDKFTAFKAKAIASPPAVPANTTSAATATDTATATAATTAAVIAPRVTHLVTVGGLVAGNPKPVLKYNPETVVANIGDIIEFDFRAANHTVTQSSFDSPCMGIPDGFRTGVQMNPNNTDNLILKQFEVKDSKPLWFYCGFAMHCQQGMVFAVNPLDKFSGFKAKALASPPANTTITVTNATATASIVPRATHMVNVGGLVPGNPKPVLKYDPESVTANIGDIIEFNFRAANHTVTQSSFESPCMGIPDGFRTGVQMNPNNTDNLILRQFEVKGSGPLWFYCGFAMHCQQGMVFAVNPLDKFVAFKARAVAAGM